MTTEYPNAIAVIALGVYAILRRPRVVRGAAYAAGVAIGVAPLALYDWWAFGSPTEISRTGSLTGPSGDDGFFGVGLPSLRATVELLFSANGLLTLSPIVACGVAGLALLYRRGRRAEAVLSGAIVLGYVALSAGYARRSAVTRRARATRSPCFPLRRSDCPSFSAVRRPSLVAWRASRSRS